MKDNKNIISKLNSNDFKTILETLKTLETSGTPEIIPQIIDLLCSTENTEIKQQISNLLNNLKDTKTIPVLIEAIKNNKNKTQLPLIVSACWQNSLDYSEYLSLFVDLFINENYFVAIEAFTIIEEIKLTNPSIDFKEHIQKLKTSISSVDENKKSLMSELIHALEN